MNWALLHILHLLKLSPLKWSSLTEFLTNVSIWNFIPFLVPKPVLNEPSSESDDQKCCCWYIRKVLKLLLQITLLYKQIVFWGQDELKQTPKPQTTWLDNPQPETSWLPKTQLRNITKISQDDDQPQLLCSFSFKNLSLKDQVGADLRLDSHTLAWHLQINPCCCC